MVIAVLLLAATLVRAQMNTAEISGTVSDPTGGVVPGATVTATQTATQQQFTSLTDANGEFLLSRLPLGEYALAVNAQGFRQAIQQGVELHAGDHIRQNFTLQLGEQPQAVTVEATAGLLQVESAEIKDVIQNRQVNDLPLKDREFLELALLSEGVVNPPGGTRGDSLQQTGKLINILGQRAGHNLFLVDGVSVTDEYFNNVVLNPAPDDVMEFNIEKTNYSAEFGGKSGGVINVVTKSGTNDLHGRLYEFARNNIFDARNFFAPPDQRAPSLQENQFGGALGGPLRKNRTFFFLNYDGQRVRNSLSQIFSVPIAAQRAGDLSGLMPGGAVLVDPISKLPIPGNRLANDSSAHIHPAAAAFLNLIALPNLAGSSNNLLAVERQRANTDQYNVRLDHRFSTADSFFARVSVFHANEKDPFGSSVLNEALLPGFGRTLTTHTVNLSLGETHTFSADLINESRFGWMYVSGGQVDPNAGNTFAAANGLLGTTANSADMGYPQISLSNTFTTMGSATGFTRRVDRDYEFYDNLLLHHGSHVLEFGGYFFHFSFNPSFPNDARGVYTFNGSYTGNALADFLLGYPSQAQVGIGDGAENAHTHWAHFYVQDGWQARPDLKINLGLRYEYNSNLVARPNQTSNVDLAAAGGPAFVIAGSAANFSATQAALAALSPIPIAPTSSVGWNDSLLTPRNLRLSPRLGLAWKIPHSRDTVVRAGFGIYTNQAAYSILQNLAENVPFYALKTVSNSSGAPAYTMGNILTANPTGAIGANGVNHDFRIEYNEVWNLTVQRPLNSSTSVSAEYIGSRTVHADSATVANVPMTLGGLRPYPTLAAYTTIRWDGWATFNGLSVKLTHRLGHDIWFDADYTWSKSLDDASDAGTTNAEYNLPENPFDMALEKARSSFDHAHRATANAVYDLPFARKSAPWLRRIAAGWRASGILILQSGAPFTANLSSAATQNVSPIGLVNGNNLERPNAVCDPNQGPRSPQRWFNTSCFVTPAPGSFGNAGRNTVMGPGFQNVDLSLQKEGTIRESLKLQFRMDSYNLFNHPNVNLPGRILGAANFGAITSALDPRQLQFALKLMF